MNLRMTNLKLSNSGLLKAPKLSGQVEAFKKWTQLPDITLRCMRVHCQF